MTINYREKRDHVRMKIECPLSFHETTDDDVVYQGRCLNLSAGGVLFATERRIPEGALIAINITPERMVVSPLNAKVEVIRTAYNAQSRLYEVAAVIREMVGR